MRKVLNMKTDKNGMFFGYIKREPNNILFNEYDNPKVNASLVYGNVYYDIVEKNGKMYAVNVRLEA